MQREYQFQPQDISDDRPIKVSIPSAPETSMNGQMRDDGDEVKSDGVSAVLLSLLLLLF